MKRKKEKLSDGTSDDISDCLAALSLQSSSAPHPQVPPPAISKMEEPVLVHYPLGHEWNSNKDGGGASDHPNTPASRAPAVTMASPSDSAVISALHLSNIDWDAASFTSSPPAQSPVGHATETEPVAEMQNASSDCQGAGSRCAAQMCLTERSLRDRLLIKNVAKAADQLEGWKEVVSRQLNWKLSSWPNVDRQEGVPSSLNRTERDKTGGNGENTTNRQDSDPPRARHRNGPAAQPSSNTPSKHRGQKPPLKYQCVKKMVSSAVATPQKRWSDPSRNRRNVGRMKNSVCVSIASSSEESDTENQQLRPPAKARIKDLAAKPTSGPKPPWKSALPVQLPRPKPESSSVETNRNMASAWDEHASPAKANRDALPQKAASPLAASDADDSALCSQSPLPLAERLRRKFLK